MALNKPTVFIQLGPSHAEQPPFCWAAFEQSIANTTNAASKHYRHMGHPDCFAYNWQKLPPVSLP